MGSIREKKRATNLVSLQLLVNSTLVQYSNRKASINCSKYLCTVCYFMKGVKEYLYSYSYSVRSLTFNRIEPVWSGTVLSVINVDSTML